MAFSRAGPSCRWTRSFSCSSGSYRVYERSARLTLYIAMSALRMRSSALVMPAAPTAMPTLTWQATCHRDGGFRVGVADEHRELVAAEPGGEILDADRAGQAAGEL